MEPNRDEVGVRVRRRTAHRPQGGLPAPPAGAARLQADGRRLRAGRARDAGIPTHWAAQTGGVCVSEDELLAEGRLVADEEWQGQLVERGLFSPGALTGKLEG
jgi:hypothetical protein